MLYVFAVLALSVRFFIENALAGSPAVEVSVNSVIPLSCVAQRGILMRLDCLRSSDIKQIFHHRPTPNH